MATGAVLFGGWTGAGAGTEQLSHVMWATWNFVDPAGVDRGTCGKRVRDRNDMG